MFPYKSIKAVDLIHRDNPRINMLAYTCYNSIVSAHNINCLEELVYLIKSITQFRYNPCGFYAYDKDGNFVKLTSTIGATHLTWIFADMSQLELVLDHPIRY